MLKSSLNGSQNQSAPPSSYFNNYDDVGTITSQLQQSSLEDTENPRLWSPQDDRIFSESADSDISESFRDLNNGSVLSNSVSESPLSHIMTSPRRGSHGSYNSSPIVADKKWHPQSPESSRFFSGGPDIPRENPSPSYSSAFESLDRSGGERYVAERSPNAVAVMHSSPLDLSFPVKDSRVSNHDSNGSLALGLGLGIAQEKRGTKKKDLAPNIRLYK
jgi:hypothetical protein